MMRWYSAKIRFVCLLENRGLIDRMDNIYVFRSKSFNFAFKKALQLAKKNEQEYKNKKGKIVRWRSEAVISLDEIFSRQIDGAEVYSIVVPVKRREQKSVTFNAEFNLKKSEPEQTLGFPLSLLPKENQKNWKIEVKS